MSRQKERRAGLADTKNQIVDAYTVVPAKRLNALG